MKFILQAALMVAASSLFAATPAKFLEYVNTTKTTGQSVPLFVSDGAGGTKVYKPTSKTSVEIELSFNALGNEAQNIFCSRSTTSLSFTFWYANVNSDYGLRWDYRDFADAEKKVYGVKNLSVNTRYLLKCCNTGLYMWNAENSSWGTALINKTPRTFTPGNQLVLFASHTGAITGGNPANLKLYSCKIYDDGVLVLSLKPCKDSDGVVCLYDEVGGVLEYPASAPLGAGPIVASSTAFKVSSTLDVGAPSPACGVYDPEEPMTVSFGAGAQSRATCEGYRLYTLNMSGARTGEVAGSPFAGAEYTFTPDGSSYELEWQLKDPEYRVVATAEGGTVQLANDGWYAAGATAQATAVPAEGSRFCFWSGDVPSDQVDTATATFTVTAPMSIAAVFSMPVDWQINTEERTITDGKNWVFTYRVADGAKPLELQITSVAPVSESSDLSICDLTDLPSAEDGTGVSGYMVKGLWGDYLFALNPAVQAALRIFIGPSVEVLDSSTVDGNNANYSRTFYQCSNLVSVTFSEQLKTLGSHAFFQFWALKHIVPARFSALRSTGRYAFQGCGALAQPLEFPVLETINVGLFSRCTNVTDLSFAAAKSIKAKAFDDCCHLTRLDLPSVEHIEDVRADEGVFRGAALDVLELPSIRTIGEYAFSSVEGGVVKIPRIEIGPSLEMLRYGAFSRNEELKEFVCEGTSCLTNLDGHAFYECHGLSQLPEFLSLETLGPAAFYNCKSLTALPVFGDKLKTISDGAFKFCAGLTGDIVIPATVTNLGAQAFAACPGIETFTAAGVVETGANLFDPADAEGGATSLKSVSLPAIWKLGDYVCRNCVKLETFEPLLQGVVHIGHACFTGCTKLSGPVVIDALADGCLGQYSANGAPGTSLFSACSGISEVTVTAQSITNLPNYTFNQLAPGAQIYWKAPAPTTIGATRPISHLNGNGKLVTLWIQRGTFEAWKTAFNASGANPCCWAIGEDAVPAAWKDAAHGYPGDRATVGLYAQSTSSSTAGSSYGYAWLAVEPVANGTVLTIW